MYLSLSFSEQNGKNCGSFMIGLILTSIMVYINKFSIIISLIIIYNQLYNIRERRLFRTYYSNNKLYNIGSANDFFEGFIYRITLNNTSKFLERLSKMLIFLNDKSSYFNKFVYDINNKLNNIFNNDIYDAIILREEEIFSILYKELCNDVDIDKNNNFRNMYLMFPKTLLKKYNPYNWFNDGYDLSMENVFLSTENEKKIEFISNNLLNKLLAVEYLIVLIGVKMNIIRKYEKAVNIHKAVVYGLNMIEDLELMLNMIDNSTFSDDIIKEIKYNFTMFLQNINIFVYELIETKFDNTQMNLLLLKYQKYNNQRYDNQSYDNPGIYKNLLLIFSKL
jgi:hypothetical protein